MTEDDLNKKFTDGEIKENRVYEFFDPKIGAVRRTYRKIQGKWKEFSWTGKDGDKRASIAFKREERNVN